MSSVSILYNPHQEKKILHVSIFLSLICWHFLTFQNSDWWENCFHLSGGKALFLTVYIFQRTWVLLLPAWKWNLYQFVCVTCGDQSFPKSPSDISKWLSSRLAHHLLPLQPCVCLELFMGSDHHYNGLHTESTNTEVGWPQ